MDFILLNRDLDVDKYISYHIYMYTYTLRGRERESGMGMGETLVRSVRRYVDGPPLFFLPYMPDEGVWMVQLTCFGVKRQ